jgi:hypothetical protein
MSCCVAWCNVMRCGVMWCSMMLCNVAWYMWCNVACDMMWCDVMWYDVMSCDVSGSTHFEVLLRQISWNYIYISVLLVLHNRQYGTVDVQSRRTVTLQSAVTMFIALYHIMRMITVFIRLYFDQINFSPQNCHTSCLYILILSYCICTNTPPALHSLSYIRGKRHSSVKGHTFRCSFLTTMNQKSVSKIMRKYNYMLYDIFFK